MTRYDFLWTNNFKQCANDLQLDLITLLVNFSFELGPIMTRLPTLPNFAFGQIIKCIGCNNDLWAINRNNTGLYDNGMFLSNCKRRAP